ncbi:MAG: hypothetical protein SGI71_03825 [Verrucomicrobiota bacterium]|nr:hypothetical protein [Verrucomicrobiota bacterium]
MENNQETEKLVKLLNLKKQLGNPGEFYFQNVGPEFNRRLRSRLLRKTWWETLQDRVSFPSFTREFGYTLAGGFAALVLTGALLINAPESKSTLVASAKPTKEYMTGSVADLVSADTQELVVTRSMAGQPAQYVLDPSPIAYESGFTF